jgi:hypothetical protein
MSDKIYVGIDGEKIELKGQELIDFETFRAELREVEQFFEAEQQAKKTAYQSAINKLTALGLNEDEVQAIVGA